MAEYHFQVEAFDDALIAEAQPLLQRHWEELARDKEDTPLDPDYEMYKRADRAGLFVVVTVRDEARRLVGYAGYFMRPHPHYKAFKWAVSDLLIVAPEHRNAGLGDQLLRFIEKSLRERGVQRMHTTTKVAHPALGRLLVACGHERIEAGYAKRLD